MVPVTQSLHFLFLGLLWAVQNSRHPRHQPCPSFSAKPCYEFAVTVCQQLQAFAEVTASQEAQLRGAP